MFSTLERERRWQEEQFQSQRRWAAGADLGPTPWYLGAGKTMVDSALSPDGRWLLAVVTADGDDNGPADKMPHYVTRSGYVDVEDVRRLVGRKVPKPQSLWLLDLQSRDYVELSMDELPGIDVDPLGELKRQQDIVPHDADQPRPVTFDRVVWHPQGGQALVQVHAIDNKDRWTLRLAAESQELKLLDHLHDPAWVNWQFNELGWIPGGDRAWWLSEASGYSHIYAESGDDAVSQLTSGLFEVSGVTWLPNGGSALVIANRSHPTEYDLYQSDPGPPICAVSYLSSAALRTYALHPKGVGARAAAGEPVDRRPSQLRYWDSASGRITQATDTLSEAYVATVRQQPEIVAVPSHHGAEQPIWTKFYPAVVLPGSIIPGFVHGAGYTQIPTTNFPTTSGTLFHNLLTAWGYHVLDMVTVPAGAMAGTGAPPFTDRWVPRNLRISWTGCAGWWRSMTATQSVSVFTVVPTGGSWRSWRCLKRRRFSPPVPPCDRLPTGDTTTIPTPPTSSIPPRWTRRLTAEVRP